MFTGLIESFGEVLSCELRAVDALACVAASMDPADKPRGVGIGTYRLVVRTDFEQIAPGESIAVDGVCLTALPDAAPGMLMFDISPETSQLTTLIRLKPTDCVHLERALLATDRIGGHYVTGHVEVLLSLKAKHWHGDCLELVFGDIPEDMRVYLLPKGSIALAGVSLTINEISQETFSVMLIPHTLKKTHLKELKVGEKLNVEFDHLTKIIVQQVRQLDLTAILK